MVNWKEARRDKLPDDQESRLPGFIQLPALPHVMVEFSRKADDPNANIGDLAKIVETDTGMTLELLKYVNSSAVGLRHKANTALQALTALGVRQANMHLLTSAVERSTSSMETKLISHAEFWDTNLERALFAREFAKLMHTDAEVAYTGGMLQDFLLPVLLGKFEEKYEQFLAGQDETPQELTDFEEQTLGWNHAFEGARLLVSWGFPDELVYCVLCHHLVLETMRNEDTGKSPALAVAISGMLPDPLRQSPHGFDMFANLEGSMPKFHLLDIIESVDRQFKELSSRSSQRTPLTDRLQHLFITSD